MPRCGRLRSFIRGYRETPKSEKLSFIVPFIIITIEIILLIHAFFLYEIFVIILTSVLVIISIIEIYLVSYEIHEHYQKGSFDRILTIKLDDYIMKKKEKNVKKILNDFIEDNPEYLNYRSKIYHITCQILETHEQEIWEKQLTDKILKFTKKRKKQTVDDILEEFIRRYPTYKKYRIKIYEEICKILGKLK